MMKTVILDNGKNFIPMQLTEKKKNFKLKKNKRNKRKNEILIAFLLVSAQFQY